MVVQRPADPDAPMKSLLTRFFRRKTVTIRNPRPGRRLRLESMEDRITPANVWVSTNSTSSQEVVREYTPSGSLLQTFIIPASGTDRRGRPRPVGRRRRQRPRLQRHLRPDPEHLLRTGGWSSRTYAGWSTVNNVSYGGIARSGNYVFVTDMNTGSGDDALKGIIRFNLADGTATRFATTFDPIDLAVGQNGRLYALDAYRAVNVYHPETLALEQSLTLPYSIGGTSQDYRAIAANAAGEMFVATWGNQIHRFTPDRRAPEQPDPADRVDQQPDRHRPGRRRHPGGRLAVRGRRPDDRGLRRTHLPHGRHQHIDVRGVPGRPAAPPAPLPGLSVSDVTVTEGNSGTTTAIFTVSLSAASTPDGHGELRDRRHRHRGSDYTAAAGDADLRPRRDHEDHHRHGQRRHDLRAERDVLRQPV